MRLVFLGTPDFALPCLDALAESGHELLLVVSQPDKARGRGRSPVPTPVRCRAQQRGLPETTLEKGGRAALYQRILQLRAEMAVVVAFGHIIKDPLLHGLPHHCLNIHASLLPRWRGPAPIHRAIIAGDRHTGVCSMRLEEGVDTGGVYRCASTEIQENETAGELHDRLAQLGARVLMETIDGIENGRLQARSQSEEGVCHAPRLSKEEGTADFRRPAAEVHDRIRGLDPWPSVTVVSPEGRLRLGGSRRSADAGDTPGKILAIGEEGLVIACAEASVRIEKVQAPGTRWMHPLEFARGHSLSVGMILLPLGEVSPRTKC